MTQQHRFLAALRRLQDWHADSTKAQQFGQTATAPGSRVLQAQTYPWNRWAQHSWASARSDAQREDLIAELETEFAELSKAPARERSVDFFGRVTWRRRIARTPGSSREVAELVGVSHATVNRYRKEFAASA